MPHTTQAELQANILSMAEQLSTASLLLEADDWDAYLLGAEEDKVSATALRSAGPRPRQTQQQPSLGVERESVTARIAHDRTSRIQGEDVANRANIHRW
jgi:hypothetical protein